jgi:hypothetical protein
MEKDVQAVIMEWAYLLVTVLLVQSLALSALHGGLMVIVHQDVGKILKLL